MCNPWLSWFSQQSSSEIPGRSERSTFGGDLPHSLWQALGEFSTGTGTSKQEYPGLNKRVHPVDSWDMFTGKLLLFHVVSWLFAWYLLHFVLETWKGSGFPIQNPACADRDEGMALFTSSRPAIPYWHLAVMPGMWDPTLHITNKWRFKESMIAPSSNHRQDWQNRNKSSGNPYGKIWQNGCECSMDWFKGKSSPETIDFPIFYGAIL